jgi:PAS domain S-box-containing protein
VTPSRGGERFTPGELGIGRLFFLVSEAVVAGDASTGAILLWNPAAERLLGYTEDEALGMTLGTLVPDELRAQHEAGLARFAQTGEITLTPPGTTVEVPARCKDGTTKWVELSLTAIPGPDERPVALALLRDVTERRVAQEQLVALNQALREFVAVTAHDLRSPLAAIRGSAGLLASVLDAGDVSKAITLVGVIDRQTSALSQMVAHLLDIAAIEAGGVATSPTDVRILDAVVEAVETAPDMDVEVRVTPRDLVARADATHLRRTLVNLLGNASEHGASPFVVSAQVVGDVVEITVSDAGDGVPTELQAHLFEKFTKGASSGTGLGLAIAKGLAVANGGDLRYDGGDGGASFTLTVPTS